MNEIQLQILKQLNHERYISGTVIGDKLNITRAAVSKNIKRLKDLYDIKVVSNTNLGHKLSQNLDLLDSVKLKRSLGNLEYFYSVDSTSSYAIANQYKDSQARIIVAEHQVNGYGRFGREWSSPFAQNIYCTMLEFANYDITKVSGLSLVISLSIAKVLQKMLLEPQIKWPNDIFVNDKKIAGVIINATAEFNDRTKLFIGFGINVNMLENATLEASWTSIQKESGLYIDRTTLLIQIVKTIKSDIKIFYNKGLQAFIESYENINYLKNKKFELNIASKSYKNCQYIALSNNGEIILDIDNSQRTFSSGEISFSDNFTKDK